MKKQRQSHWILLIICFMYLILYVDRVNIATVAPFIKADLALSNTEIGLALSAFAYPYAAFQLIGGYLGDKFGSRLTLTVSVLIVCVATAWTATVQSLAGLFVARFALGIGEGATLPTATRAMAVWIPKHRWGFAQGITHTFARLGNALTPPLIVLLLGLMSWRESFLVVAVFSFLWVILWVWSIRGLSEDHPQMNSPGAHPHPPLRERAKEPIPWFGLFRRMLPVTAVDFCYGWTLWLFLSWIPSFFYQNYKLDLKDSAFFSAGVFLAGVAGDTMGGVLSDYILRRTGSRTAARRNVIVLGMLGGFVFLLPVMFVDDVKVVAIFLSTAFFFVELIVAPIWVVPMDIAPNYACSASGMMNLGFGLAGIISPLVFGYLIDLSGSWTLPFGGSFILLLTGAFLAFQMHPDRPFESL